MPLAGQGPQLPPDSTGKVTGSFTFGTTPVIHIPVSALVDPSGNAISYGDNTNGLWVNVKALPTNITVQTPKTSNQLTGITSASGTQFLDVTNYASMRLILASGTAATVTLSTNAGNVVASPVMSLATGAVNTTGTVSISGADTLEIDTALVDVVKVTVSSGTYTLTYTMSPYPALISAGPPTAMPENYHGSRLPIDATLRLYDSGSTVGSRLVTAPGDITSGQWVNIKASSATIAVTSTQLPGSLYATRLTGAETALPVRAIIDQRNAEANSVSTTLNMTSISNTTSSINVDGYSVIGVHLGTTAGTNIAGSGQAQFLGSVDNTNFYAITAYRANNSTLTTTAPQYGAYLLNVAGFKYIKVGVFATGSETAMPVLVYENHGGTPYLLQGPGSNSSLSGWAINDNSSSLTVDAPVGTPLFARLSDGAAALIGQKTMTNSLPVAFASDQSSLPVTIGGTVPLATGAATDATLTGGAGKMQIVDGTPTNVVTTATAAPAGTERGLITRSIVSGGGWTAQTGTLAAVTGSITATSLGASGNVTFTVFGTYGSTAGNIAYIFEASPDSGTTWAPISALREDTGMSETTGQLPNNGIRTWQFAMGGYDQIRFRVTTWGATASGTLSGRWTPGGFFFEPSPMTTPSRGARAMFGAVVIGGAGVTAEALLTVSPTRAGVTGASVSSLVVTPGKVLRITGLQASTRAGAASATWTRWTLRTNPTGAVVVSSPVLWVGEAGTPAAVIGSASYINMTFPDGGFEFTGLEQIGVTHISSATTNVESFTLFGFEY